MAARPDGSAIKLLLVRLAALLLTRTLARKRLLGAAAIARLQVERMLLDILDDIFLLYLPLEAAKRAFDGLAFLYFDFSQALLHPLSGQLSTWRSTITNRGASTITL